MSEDLIGERVYRTRVVAELEHNNVDGAKKPEVKGVLGLSIDVTHIKARAQLELDNTRLMLEEQAAKDSSRLKSQFLANVRSTTLITGRTDNEADVPRDENSNCC